MLCDYIRVSHTVASDEYSGGSVFFRLRLRRLFAVALVEAVNAARRVHKLLLAREERVTLRADFHMKVFFARRARRELVAAGALHLYVFVVWMNSLLHFLLLTSL